MDINIYFPGGKRVAAAINGFTVDTDQSVKQGGGGTAPDPFQLFIASIATCMSWYALNFCLERNISVSDLAVKLRTQRDEGKKIIDKITFEITPPPDFPAKYHAALIRSVGLCTVKKHLQNPPEFETIIVGKSSE